MQDDNTAPSMLVGVPTDNLPSTQIQNDNSNKKMLIISGSIGGVLLVIGVVIFLLLSGSTATMVGTWVNSDGDTFSFNEDGTFSDPNAHWQNATTSWDVNGDMLTINFEMGEEWVIQTSRFSMSSDGDAVWMQISVEASDGSNSSTGPACLLIVRESLLERDYTTSEDFKLEYENSKPEWCA